MTTIQLINRSTPDDGLGDSLYVGAGKINTSLTNLNNDKLEKSIYDPANIAQQLVGTTATQTLTNKTLTSPVINTGISGSAIDATTTLGTSNTKVPTQGAVKSYVDSKLGNSDNLTEGTTKLLMTPTERESLSDLGLMFPFIFEASNTIGTVNVASELQTIIEAAAGKAVFVPPGTYLVNGCNPDASIVLWAVPGTVIFKNTLDNACIDTLAYETWFNANTVSKSVTAIVARAAFPDGFTATVDDDMVTKLTVADASNVFAGETWKIYSSDNHPYAVALGKNAFLGEAFKVLGVSGNDIYVQGVLRWIDNPTTNYTTNINILKYPGGRQIHISGIDFEGAATTFGLDTAVPPTMFGNQRSVTSITRSSTTATVTTASPHSLVNGNKVKIEGAAQAQYNQSVIITVTSATTFTFTIPTVNDDGDTQTQTPTTPATGTLTYKVIFDTSSGVNHSTSLVLRNCQYVIVENCEFRDIWAGAIRLYQCPGATVRYCRGLRLCNANTANQSAVGSVGQVGGRLGYFVITYGTCGGTVVHDCYVTGSRHVVTTGCPEESSFNTVNGYRQGQPTNITFRNIVSYGCFGVPFDTHEEAREVLFDNCSAYYPQRGPQNGSYSGYGMQIRCSNAKVKNYYQIGGTYGIRIAPGEQPDSTHEIESAYIESTTNPSDNDYAVRTQDITSYTNKTKINIGRIRTKNCGRTIYVESGNVIKVDELSASAIRARAVQVMGTGKIYIKNATMDFSDDPAGGSSTNAFSLYNTAECHVGTLYLIQGVSSAKPARIFANSDALAGKVVSLGKLIYHDPNGVASNFEVLNKTAQSNFTFVGGGEAIILDVGDETTALTTGVAKKTFLLPNRFLLRSAHASLTTAGSSGTVTVDINKNGASIFSTNKLTIDVSETDSTTAATPPTYSVTQFAPFDKITVDIDVISTGAAGLKVYLLGYYY